jgi:hypothetical protein
MSSWYLAHFFSLQQDGGIVIFEPFLISVLGLEPRKPFEGTQLSSMSGTPFPVEKSKHWQYLLKILSLKLEEREQQAEAQITRT